MSRSNRVFRLIQSQLPGTSLCGDILVVGRTNYILRGFLLDTTSQKDHMTLWKIVMPLFRPLSHLMLNYSSKIAGKYHERVLVDTKAYPQSAKVVLDEINDHIDPLKRLSRPADFLKYIAPQYENPNLQVRFDFGITHYLIGNRKQSLAIFEALAKEIIGETPQCRESIMLRVEFVLRQLKTDPQGMLIAIDAWRLQNIELFDLKASCNLRSTLNPL